MFSDIALSRRLERAEGYACMQFADARKRVSPENGAAWIECGGAYAVFDGVTSPVTQSFGLGVFEPLTEATLDAIERFFFERGAPAQHEVSPMAGFAALDLLCVRNYRPIEISSVLYKPVEKPSPAHGAVSVRVIGPEEERLWADIGARGWADEHPELIGFLRELGAVYAARQHSPCFLGAIDDRPGAAAALCLHEGVALFAGAATVPEMRRRGLQAALLEERMRYAFDHGCDLAMMVAEAGSNSQRNAERQGFRIAYTRTKWRLDCPGASKA